MLHHSKCDLVCRVVYGLEAACWLFLFHSNRETIFRQSRDYATWRILLLKFSSFKSGAAIIAPAIGTKASAVVTKETTDEDSNWLPRKPVNETAVAIRKARRLANDWRKQAEPADGYRSPEKRCFPAHSALASPYTRPLEQFFMKNCSRGVVI